MLRSSTKTSKPHNNTKMRRDAPEFRPGSGLIFGALKTRQPMQVEQYRPCKEFLDFAEEWKSQLKPKLLQYKSKADFIQATIEIQALTRMPEGDPQSDLLNQSKEYFEYCVVIMKNLHTIEQNISRLFLADKFSKYTAAKNVQHLCEILLEFEHYVRCRYFKLGAGQSRFLSFAEPHIKSYAAMYTKQIDLIEYLNNRNSYPLHIAIEANDQAQISFLIKLGLSPYTVSDKGISAFNLVKKLQRPDLEPLLSGRLALPVNRSPKVKIV